MKCNTVLLVLCFVHIYPVDPASKDCSFENYEAMAKKLEEIKKQKNQRLELFANTIDTNERTNIEKEMHSLIALEEEIKDRCKTLRKGDILTAEQREKFLKEKENLRIKLLTAEGLRGHTRDQALQHLRDRIMGRVYHERYELATQVRNDIERDFNEFTEERFVNDIKKKQDEKEMMAAVQDRHSRVLKTMATTLQKGLTPVSVPHQDEINKLRTNIKGTHNEELFQETHLRLEDLLDKLYEESQLSSTSPLRDLENELTGREENIIRKRDQQHKLTQEILEELMSKTLQDYTEEDIDSLQKSNLLVAALDTELQNLARQGAYLKAISQVAQLLNECSVSARNGENKLLEDSQGLQVGESSVSGHGNPGTQVEEIATAVHEKGLNLKLMLDLFRNHLNTDIAAGLYRITKNKIPRALIGCDTTKMIQIQERMKQWSANVKYSLRLTKRLYKDIKKPKPREMCLGFLAGIWDSFFGKTNGEDQQDVGMEDDEGSSSIEEFRRQDKFEFKNHFAYLGDHLTVLDFDGHPDEKSLRDFRRNFISVREVSELLKYMGQKMLQEARGNANEVSTNALQSSKSFLKVAHSIEKELRQLFDTTKSRVKSNIQVQLHEFQSAVEEHERCRAELDKRMDELFFLEM